MSGKAKAIVCYVAALVYTVVGISLLKVAFGDVLQRLPTAIAAALYVVFVLPVVALMVYGYGQWLKTDLKKIKRD